MNTLKHKFWTMVVVFLGVFNSIQSEASGSQNLIAYNQLVDAQSQNYDVFIMDMDGKNRKNLTNTPAVEWVYYAHKNKLFYLSDQDQCHRCFYLYSMDSKGENKTKITDFYLADSWFSSRKNGTELIVKPKADDADFYIINLQGDVLKRINLDFEFVGDPAFSPDGQKFIFRAADVASPRVPGFADELYLTDVDGGVPTQLTKHPEHKARAVWRGYLAAAPRWQSNDEVSYGSVVNGQFDIFSIDINTREIKKVTASGGSKVYHDWSEDGHLVYEVSPDNRTGYEIFIQAPGDERRQLTDDKKDQYAPVFVEKTATEPIK